MEEEWECEDVEKVKPLDELLEDKVEEFESGRVKKCDKDLDVMIWKLGDYENEEPPQEAEEFAEDPPVEEELIEKEITVAGNGRVSFREGRLAAETHSAAESIVGVASIGSEARAGRKRQARANAGGKRGNDGSVHSRTSIVISWRLSLTDPQCRPANSLREQSFLSFFGDRDPEKTALSFVAQSKRPVLELKPAPANRLRRTSPHRLRSFVVHYCLKVISSSGIS